ncbi:MAG: DNA mismatch repair endonuclease MutL [Ignavibacteriales bacterium]|nr:DNA mismatch repair endonuclease MutL [Ignavibacteriales bacterium]
MPGKIHILQPELANKIAAGEVVQRPASVVKELVENALDAHATRIEIQIRDAGRTFIQVADNGEGMSDEDAVRSFQRHATSKIRTSEDLENIRTLGFRGEALASIAAVSHAEMKTRTDGNDLATFLRFEGIDLKEHSRTAFQRGTSVTVKNLFFNTPARRNFLKTNTTELKNITDVVMRAALAYPEVEFRYQADEEILLDCKSKQSEGRLAEVFGERQASGLVGLRESTEWLQLDGYIGKPDFARKVRAENYIYLNRRSITSRMIQHAVFQAYEHLLEKGSFPLFILNLTIDPHKVDVNVHPSKMEVKFENESNVYRMVVSVVRKTLAANDLVPRVVFQEGNAVVPTEDRLRFAAPNGTFVLGMPAPVFTLTPEARSKEIFLSATRQAATRQAASSAHVLRIDELFSRSVGPETLRAPIFPVVQEEKNEPSGEQVFQHSARPGSAPAPGIESRAIWQIHHKYIVSQIKTGLMIVDQHVAHERVLYERVLENFENSLPTSQQLLFPQTVELTASDYAMVKDIHPHLERLGFELKLFGKNTIVIEGIPADVQIGNERKILQDVLDEFKNNEHAGTIDARDNLAKSFACKAAVKAGDKLNTNEMIVLIDQLFATQMPYVCPHGRPIVIKIATEELDKRFGRT